MKKIIILALPVLLLSACAQTPEQAAAMQRLSAQLLSDPQPVYAPMPRNTTTRCHKIGNSVTCNQY